MRIEEFTNTFKAKKLQESDLNDIYDLCKTNTLFYQFHPPFVTKESILDDMQALPPDKTPNDKLYFGFYDGNKLVAIMDLILRYPNENTAFIGLFMVDTAYQGHGIGSRIIQHCVNVLKKAGFSLIRLGIDDGNPQSEKFWLKNNFIKTGEVKKQEHSVVVPMERKL